MTDVLNAIWTFLNSPIGLTIAGALLLMVLGWIARKKPQWQQYEGRIIEAIKWAEKAIPDDTPNKGAQRLDAALGYVVRLYVRARGTEPPKALIHSIREGIPIVHAQLEAGGNLEPSTVAKTGAMLLLCLALALGACGCQAIIVSPGAVGPITITASNGAVVLDGQQTSTDATAATQPAGALP